MSLIKWIAPVVALGIVFGFVSMAKAADTGTVTVTVTGTDGKPAADVSVKIVTPPAKKDKAAPKADKPAGGHAKPVAEGKTDADGKCTLKDVAVGDYAVIAGSKTAGMGHEKVTVEAGKTAEVSITLKAAKAAAGGGAGDAK